LEGTVRYRAASLIGAAGMLAAPVGVLCAQIVPNGPLLIAFAFVLGWSGWCMYRRSLPTAERALASALPPCVLNADTGRLNWTRPCARALAATGACSGLMSGLLGVGGGFLIVPALTRFTDLPAKSVVNTSLSVIALVSVAGVASSASHGLIEWSIAIPFTCGAGAALVACRGVRPRLAVATSQRAFAALSLLAALLLFWRGLRSMAG
ncbi:TSUP family transporter, partial [Roseateles sp. P5_E11]